MSDLNTQYPSNSDRARNNAETPPVKPPTHNIKPVVSGGVKEKKMSPASKFMQVFIAEDVSNVRQYVWSSVMVPMLKKALTDIVATGCDLITNSFSMLVNGTYSSGVNQANWIGSGTRYDKCFVSAPNNSAPAQSAPKKNKVIKDFTFQSRDDANRVLQSLMYNLRDFGVVSCGDLYEAISRTPDDWQVYNVGWKDLSSARIQHDVRSGGWTLYLPEMISIR